MRALYLLIVITMFSCNETHSERKTFQSYSDTASIWGISNNEWHQRFTDALNLSNIANGVDSFELRLWCSLVITDLKLVTILKYSDSSWKLSETQYWVTTDEKQWKRLEFTIDSSKTKNIIPKLPFNQVIDSIKSYRLDTAITQRKIPNFRYRTADGMSYTIEIATRNSYRCIDYSNPFSYSDTNDKQITRFLSFMGRNLSAFIPEQRVVSSSETFSH